MVHAMSVVRLFLKFFIEIIPFCGPKPDEATKDAIYRASNPRERAEVQKLVEKPQCNSCLVSKYLGILLDLGMNVYFFIEEDLLESTTEMKIGYIFWSLGFAIFYIYEGISLKKSLSLIKRLRQQTVSDLALIELQPLPVNKDE